MRAKLTGKKPEGNNNNTPEQQLQQEQEPPLTNHKSMHRLRPPASSR